jgi:hypothetical protein
VLEWEEYQDDYKNRLTKHKNAYHPYSGCLLTLNEDRSEWGEYEGDYEYGITKDYIT